MKVMLIEDEKEVRELATQALGEQGFEVVSLDNGERILEEIKAHRPNVLLLDQLLPGKSGVECVQELRRLPQYQGLPIIMVTGLGAEKDILKAFECGADDYVTKPFLPRELGARIKAVARRGEPQTVAERLTHQDLTIDLNAHRVLISGTEISLTLTEYRILVVLLSHKEQVLKREILRERALDNLNVTDRTIDVHMTALRKKLGSYGDCLCTVRGVGYRFSPRS